MFNVREAQMFRFSNLYVHLVRFSALIQRDAALKRKYVLRKLDTEIFEKVFIYSKPLSLNELNFLMHSLILLKFIKIGTANTRKVSLCK